MKGHIFLFALFLCTMIPTSLSAQDDMYFVPKKKAVEKVKITPEKEITSEEASLSEETVSFPERDVDEYNRRYRFERVDSVPEAETGTGYHFEIVEEEGEEEEELDGEWVNGFEGSEEDYSCAKRILVFRSPTAGIPVSSPLYWELCYGPSSIYWNVYDDGFYAYVFPTVWNRYYYGPWRSGYWWGYDPYWHYGYWGYGSYWHHPYWYGSYWHRPYYGRPYYGWYNRPHTPYRTSRSSLTRTGVIRNTSTGRTNSSVVRNSSSSRGARVVNPTSTTNNRTNKVSTRTTTRSVNRANQSTERKYTPNRPVQVERSVPNRSMPSRSTGSGVSRGARTGGVSRGGR